MKNINFFLTTVLLVLTAVFSIRGTVFSQSRDAGVDVSNCRMAEEQYTAQVRSCLEEEGYQNCGITVTRIREENKPVAYTVRVHHRRINGLELQTKETLRRKLAGIGFPLSGCTSLIEFPEN